MKLGQWAAVISLVGLTSAGANPYSPSYGEAPQASHSSPGNALSATTALATEHAVARSAQAGLSTTAGVSSDSKDVATETSATAATTEWFKKPAIFAEYQFYNVDDQRTGGADGGQHNFSVGFDFQTAEDIVVGFLYTYSNEDDTAFSAAVPTTLQTQGHYFSAYAAKNFFQYMNVGASLTYAKKDLNTSNAGLDADIWSDIFSAAPFIGASYITGAWSFSATPTFLYQTEYADGGFGAQSYESWKLLWLNNVEYAVSDKFLVRGILNWNHMLHDDPINVGGNDDRSWVTIGTRLTYYFCESVESFVGAEYDVLNRNYDKSVRFRLGATYSF
jgi:hypothetical protein